MHSLEDRILSVIELREVSLVVQIDLLSTSPSCSGLSLLRQGIQLHQLLLQVFWSVGSLLAFVIDA